MTKRFLLFVGAFLLLGIGGFIIVIVSTPSPSSPLSSLPSEQNRDSASLSLSISDDPVVLDAEVNDTQLDTFEQDMSDLEQEIDSN